MPEAVPHRRGALRQMGTLTRRYVRVIAADRGYLLFMGLLPIILGVLIRLVGSKQGLASLPRTSQNASETLVLLVVCACLAGAASSVRELVKERPIYIRERAAGLSSGAYCGPSCWSSASSPSCSRSCWSCSGWAAGRCRPRARS